MKLKNVLPFFAVSVLILTTACNERDKYIVTKDENGKLIAQKITEKDNTKEIKEVEKKLSSITEFTEVDKGFSIWTSMIKAADLSEVLKVDGRFTVFAPIDTAFDKLPEGAVEKLLLPENKEELIAIIRYHIIPSVITKEDIVIAINNRRGSVPLRTLGGNLLTASLKGDSVFLIDEMGNGGKLITTDLEASNGFVNTIDAVMKPKK